MNYSPFKNFIFRIPVFPFNRMNNFSFDNPTFNIAIKLASPVLYAEIKKHKSDKIKQSLYKYKTRAHTRATPFGCFAGIGIGQISDSSGIALKEDDSYLSTNTRLDMDFMFCLLKEIEKDKNIQTELQLFVNNTLYKVKHSYRYIEYKIHNNRRTYFVSEIESSEVLDFLVEIVKTENILSKITVIIKEKFEVENSDEIISFINELIDCQFLTTNLEPKVTSADLLDDAIVFLESIIYDSKYENHLKKLKTLLNNFDTNPITAKLTALNEIEHYAAEMKINYNSKYLTQTDTIINTTKAEISRSLINDVKKALKVLNKITPKTPNIALNDFKKEFHKRYDNEFIPLEIVLDPDLGIGISNLNFYNTDISPIISGISNDKKRDKDDNYKINKIQALLLEKYNELIKYNLVDIVLTDTDLIDFEDDYDDLPNTLSVLLEVINIDDNNEMPKLFVNSAHGPSAANLTSRFSHINDDFKNILQEICDIEKSHLSKNEILAEIVHLPEDRTGNIVLRNINREYEIPYLSQSSKSKNNQIPISDILVQVPNGGRVILWSKRLQKEIIPIHSSAYNYNVNTIPVFVFLSLLQGQNKRQSLYLNWGAYFKSYKYLPRVVYDNIILSPKTWNIKKQYDSKFEKASNLDMLLSYGNDWRIKNGIPDKVLLINGDNKLLIEFTNETAIDIFFKELKKRDCKLTEYFEYGNKNLVSQSKNNFKNEVIINFFKND